VADLINYAACELQVSGALAGQTFCAHWSSAALTIVADQYLYVWGLDQTFSGSWISPTSYNRYVMKGNIWVSRSGFTKTSAMEAGAMPAPASTLGGNQQKVLAEQNAGAELQPQADLGAAMSQLAEEMRRGLISTQ
jgi:hypothetical protein